MNVTGSKFFAGSRLTDDQNRRAAWSELLEFPL
jgi:hypothetical protein